MRNKKILIDRISETIKDILIENQLILGDKADNKIKREVGLALLGERLFLDTKTIEIESDELYIFIECSDLLKNEEILVDKVDKILNKLDENFIGNTKINIYFINYTYYDELCLRNELNKYGFKKKLENNISKMLKNLKVEVKPNEMYDFKFLIVNKVVKKDYKIAIDSRIRSLEHGLYSKENLKVKGYVFIANLCDIVEIFNDIGNEIFEYNVRLGIEDKFNVAKEITKTIKEEPEEFWFLNNGITILVNDDKFNIRKPNSISLTYGDDKIISIINGAQTITAAADTFYDKENKLNEREIAKVMLRIIHIKENDDLSNEGFKDLANKISLSLNRQKPIAPEDLAFTTDFVTNINHLWEHNKMDKYTFQLVKRSKNEVANGVKLEDFARASKACLEQNPGQARSNARATLIKIETNESNRYCFKNDIFKIEFLNSESSNLENLYKYYKPINLAKYISNHYQINAEKIKNKIKAEDEKVVINYGKWFFIAYIVYVLNYENNNDFTKFEFNYPENKKIDYCIEKFSEIYSESMKENKDNFDSNNFKSNNIYERFKINGIKNSKKLEEFKILIFKTFNNDDTENFINYLYKSQVAITKEF